MFWFRAGRPSRYFTGTRAIVIPHIQQLSSVWVRCLSFRGMSEDPSKKFKVYVTRRVPTSGVDLLRSQCCIDQWDNSEPVPRNELLTKVRGCDALFCLLTDKIDKEVLDAAGPQLKVIGTMSVGYDHLDVHEIKRRGIAIGFTPDVLTNATAELTVTLLLTTSRRAKEGIRAVADGSWGTWDPLWLCGQGLEGSTVGIVGLGRIGFAVAKRIKSFDVENILYCGHNRKKEGDDTSIAERDDIGAIFVSFDELLSLSDFVVVCAPLTEETKGLFNKNTFGKMKRNAIFINTSRGGLVNQDDLYTALKDRVIQSAGLDVTSPEPLPTNSPLLKLDNCVVFPHIGSATLTARSAMSLLTGKNILAKLNGERMPNELITN